MGDSKDDRNKKVVKSGLWFTISNFVVKSVVFISMPVFTRMLSQSEFGDYSNYMSWLSIASYVVTLNIEASLSSARFDYKDHLDMYISSMLGLSTLSVVIWMIALNIFSVQLQSITHLDILYLNIMMLYLLFTPAINMYQARERYKYNYKMTVFISMLIAIGSVILSILFVLTMNNRLTGRIIGSSLPTIIVGILLFVYFLSKGKLSVNYWGYALPICIPYLPHLLSLTVLNSTDRVMISRWCGSEATALYSLAYTCGTMVNLLMISLNSAFSTWQGEMIFENKCNDLKKVSYKYILVFFFFAFGVMLIAPEALYILGGKIYQEAIYVMPPVTMGCCCQFLYTMFVNVEQFKRKTIGMAIASVIAAGINIGLNWIFIPRFGYMAAAYTTLAGYMCLLAMHMYLVFKMGFSDAFDYQFIVIVIIFGLFITGIVNILYENIILRYFFIMLYSFLLLFLLYKYRNQIKEILRKK